MDSYTKAQYIRRRVAFRDGLRKIRNYTLIGAAVLGFAYLSDKCNASEMIETGAKKSYEGIEYIVSRK